MDTFSCEQFFLWQQYQEHQQHIIIRWVFPKTIHDWNNLYKYLIKSLKLTQLIHFKTDYHVIFDSHGCATLIMYLIINNDYNAVSITICTMYALELWCFSSLGLYRYSVYPSNQSINQSNGSVSLNRVYNIIWCFWMTATDQESCLYMHRYCNIYGYATCRVARLLYQVASYIAWMVT